MHEELQQMAWDAEDEGKDVYVARHDETGIIEYLEVDGREILNPDYADEVKDAYLFADTERAAGLLWEQ